MRKTTYINTEELITIWIVQIAGRKDPYKLAY
jgi:hypothetical protein